MSQAVSMLDSNRRIMLAFALLQFASTSFLVSHLRAQGHTRAFDQLPISASMGLNAQFTNGTGDLNQIRDMGVGYVRHSFQWTSIEQSIGNYNWSTYDTYVNNMEARGMGIVFPLAYDNALYEPVGAGRGITTDAGRQGYANWAAAAVDRYKGRDIIWELWNEPNTGGFWSGSSTTANSQAIAKEYTDLVKTAVPAMRAADPHAKIVAGSASVLWQGSFNWMQYCFEEGILQTGIDGWSVHSYRSQPEHAAFGNSDQWNYNNIRQYMTTYGGASEPLPILNSESGWTAASGDAAQEEVQASRYVRQVMIDSLADVRLTVWYDWDAEPSGNHDIKENGRLRPAYFAAQTLANELDGYSFSQRVFLPSFNDYALLFTKENERKLVAWTSSNPHDASFSVNTTDNVLETTTMLGVLGSVDVVGGSINLSLGVNPTYIDLGIAPVIGPTLVVDRLTGEVAIANTVAGSLNLKGYSISSAAGVLDPAGWSSINAGGVFDPDGSWTTQQLDDFAIIESVTGGTLDGGTLAGQTSHPIGAWGPWFDASGDDLTFSYSLSDGTTGVGEILFTGPPISDGDADFDGDVDDDDVAAFISHWRQEQLIEGQLVGNVKSRRDIADFNYDGETNFADWFILRTHYGGTEPLNLSALLGESVPEPTSLVLASIALFVFLGARRSSANRDRA